MTGKIAWLIVSDLHLYYKNISSHTDYVSEMVDVRLQIIRVAKKYKLAGYEQVNLLLLGDVFHRSYNSVGAAINDNNFFVMWNEQMGECYSVIGNHELSYYVGNPFFSMVNRIDSEKLSSVRNKVWSPTGLLSVIKVVDELACGNVTFYFNHYGCPVSRPSKNGQVCVGLFHQELISKEVKDVMSGILGHEVYADEMDLEHSGVFENYDYCFLGHMHQAAGIWKDANGTILYYLASLGRTNVLEVHNDFLRRNIPVVKVADGLFDGVDDNFFDLWPVEKSLNVAKVLQNAEKGELAAKKRKARSYVPLDDDPVKSLLTYYATDEYCTTIVRDLLSVSLDAIGSYLKSEFFGRFDNDNTGN